MSKINLKGLISNQALFRGLSDFELDILQKEVTKVELSKGLTLFQKGDLSDGCYILVYGLIKLGIPSSQGNDKVLELIKPGQSFGEAMMFIDETYPFYAEALETSLLLRLPKQVLMRQIERTPAVAMQIMAGLSQRFLGLIKGVERHSLQNATQRVTAYLLQVAEQQDTCRIRLELKKNLVASLLDLTPETLSRVLHQLADEGLITVNGSQIHILSLDALNRFHYGSSLKVLHFTSRTQNLLANSHFCY